MKGPKQKPIISLENLKIGLFSGIANERNNEETLELIISQNLQIYFIITTNLVTSNKIVPNLKGLT